MQVNILHLTHTDISSDSRILKEMQAIASTRSSVKVSGIGVTIDEGSSQAENLSNISIEAITLNSRSWAALPTFLRHLCSLIELSCKMVKRAVELKPNVIHCHDTLVLPLGVVVRILTGSKLIYDAHELESDRNGLSQTLGKLTLFVEKVLWRFVDALIVVSPSIEKWYAKNLGKKDITVIFNAPVLTKEEGFDPGYLRRKYEIPDEANVFIYVGILGEGRGLDLILDVFKKDDINDHVVFLGYGSSKGLLREASKKHSNIHVHDAVPHEMVVPVLKSADVGLCLIQNVSLSDYYCLPNKLFEYCFAGIPILASDFPDISQLIERYNLGKSCKLDSQSIYEAIKEFEEMDELPKIKRNDLYALSWGAQEEKLIKLYNNLI